MTAYERFFAKLSLKKCDKINDIIKIMLRIIGAAAEAANLL